MANALENHHIILQDHLTDPNSIVTILSKAKKINIDDDLNRLYLPNDAQLSAQTNIVRHASNHSPVFEQQVAIFKEAGLEPFGDGRTMLKAAQDGEAGALNFLERVYNDVRDYTLRGLSDRTSGLQLTTNDPTGDSVLYKQNVKNFYDGYGSGFSEADFARRQALAADIVGERSALLTAGGDSKTLFWKTQAQIDILHNFPATHPGVVGGLNKQTSEAFSQSARALGHTLPTNSPLMSNSKWLTGYNISLNKLPIQSIGVAGGILGFSAALSDAKAQGLDLPAQYGYAAKSTAKDWAIGAVAAGVGGAALAAVGAPAAVIAAGGLVVSYAISTAWDDLEAPIRAFGAAMSQGDIDGMFGALGDVMAGLGNWAQHDVADVVKSLLQTASSEAEGLLYAQDKAAYLHDKVNQIWNAVSGGLSNVLGTLREQTGDLSAYVAEQLSSKAPAGLSSAVNSFVRAAGGQASLPQHIDRLGTQFGLAATATAPKLIDTRLGEDGMMSFIRPPDATPGALPVRETYRVESDGKLAFVAQSNPYGQQFGSANGSVAATQAANALLDQALAALRNGAIDNVAAMRAQTAASMDYRFDATDFAALGVGGTVTMASVIGSLQVHMENPTVGTDGRVSGNFVVANASGAPIWRSETTFYPSSVPPGGTAAYFLDTTSAVFAPTTPVPVNNSILNNQYSPTGTFDGTWFNPGAGWMTGVHTNYGSHLISLDPSILNDPTNRFYNWAPSLIAGDGYSPGRGTLSSNASLFSSLADIYDARGNRVGSLWDIPISMFDLSNQSFEFVDPLVVDLNGDGVKTRPFTDGGVRFDIDADPYLEHTSWLSSDDGFLVRDLDNDGNISSITEIVSDYFNGRAPDGAAGVQVLAAYDSNLDGVFSAADAEFADFRIWRDANENGVTDAGELLTLAQAGVAAFDLSYTATNGLVVDGAEVLTRGTALMSDGGVREALSIDFVANPFGSLVEALGDEYRALLESFQGGTDVAVLIGGAAPLAIDLGASNPNGYAHVFGTDGDDSIIGDAQNNWIVGSRGRDILKGGAGNDFIIVDAQDDLAQLDGGAGFDVVQAVGSGGVILNLTRANIEAAIGSSGSDILVGGGYSNTFIDGGVGDDFIYGGAADDALSGGDGDDLIEGMAGDDLIRGHRGEDLLRGGEGDDLLFGGESSDVLLGGDGNDLLEGGQGDDALDGGAGSDTVNFTGKLSDYSVTRDGGDWIFRDRRANGDGVDRLSGVELVNFGNLKGVSLDHQSAFLVNDVIDGAGLAPITIAAASLTGNDIDFQGNALAIREALNAVGGSVSLNAQGDVVFTPTAGYFGVRGFQYKIVDSDGYGGTLLEDIATGQQAEMKGTVWLRDTADPTDPLFYDQWYLSDANILPVWKDYTGKGVDIGIVELGVMNFNHPDLAPNVSSDFLENYPTPTELIQEHTTLVAGVIGAARNGEGSVGVAYDAELSSFALEGPYPEVGFRQFDIVNNSWGYVPRFVSNFLTDPTVAALLEEGAAFGRDGLGTATVFASGNSRASGDNANYENIGNNRFAISVGAINANADIGSLVTYQAAFSTPGANILVSAPGSNIVSTSNLLKNSNGSTFGDDYEAARGTSFATPIVSGVIALMLEANPNLGYRDIQKILAYSAKQVDATGSDWTFNGAYNWNGGGLHVSHDYGFGIVDALAAVRLAETWTEKQTYYNEHSEGVVNEPGDGVPIPIQDGGGLSWTSNVNLGDWFSLEHVQVRVDLDHANLGDLVITLISPDGTRSVLLDRPGVSTTDPDGDGAASLNFTFGSTHYWGEQISGTWTLQVADANMNGASGTLKNWELQFFGEDTNFNDTYIYTNEFGALGAGGRATLVSNGGSDTLNAAAITSNSIINLTPGSISTLAGRQLTIADPSAIYNAFAGDGDDQLIGSGGDNALYGGRGNDALSGGGGRDILSGDRGNDTMTGGAGQDIFVIEKRAGDADAVVDFKAGGVEKLAFVGFGEGFSFDFLAIAQVGADTVIDLGDGQTVTLRNFTAAQLVANDIAIFDDFRFLSQTTGTAGADTYVWSGANDWLALGDAGSDTLKGDAGDDMLMGGTGQDLLIGGAGRNTLVGGADADLFVIASNPGKVDTITDFVAGERDRIAIVGFGGVGSFGDLVMTQVDADTIIDLGTGQTLVIRNTTADSLTLENFVFLATFPYMNQVTGSAGVEAFQWGGPAGLIAFGEGGDDIIIGYDYADALYGGDGDDVLVGAGGDDQLDGGGGNDLLDGGAGNDTLTGGAGADVFAIAKQPGSTTVITDWKASGGRDKLVFELFSSPLSLTPVQQGADTVLQLADDQKVVLKNTLVSSLTSDDLVLVDTWQVSAQFSGTDLADTFAAPDDANYVMWAHGGNDQVYGGYGIDQIYGGDGDDLVVGEPENTSGVGGDDVLYGGAGNDQMFGGGGSDVIRGEAGNDYIQGDQGDDVLIGGAAYDRLFGGAGNDTLILENEDDDFYGQAGSDRFVVLDDPSFQIGSGLKNLIVDFDASAAGDKIDLSDIPTATSMADIEQIAFTYQGYNFSRVYVAGINSNQYVTLYHGTGTAPALIASNFIFSSGTMSLAMAPGQGESLPEPSDVASDVPLPQGLSAASRFTLPDDLSSAILARGYGDLSIAGRDYFAPASPGDLEILAAASWLTDSLSLGPRPFGQVETVTWASLPPRPESGVLAVASF